MPQALLDHRRRQAERGFQRLEVRVPRGDAALVRAVAAALADPAQADAARAVLTERFAAPPGRTLKDLLAAAPLEGIDLDRSRDTGRAADL